MSSRLGKPRFVLQWQHNRLKVWVSRPARGLRTYKAREASYRRLLRLRESYPNLVRDWGK